MDLDREKERERKWESEKWNSIRGRWIYSRFSQIMQFKIVLYICIYIYIYNIILDRIDNGERTDL